eukprot:3270181-Pleurochrysis_carterae.AAC.2
MRPNTLCASPLSATRRFGYLGAARARRDRRGRLDGISRGRAHARYIRALAGSVRVRMSSLTQMVHTCDSEKLQRTRYRTPTPSRRARHDGC